MKIKKLMFASTAILFGICSQSCVSAASNAFEKLANLTMGEVEKAGPMKTITIQADKVTSIDTSSGIRVEYTQGSGTSVTLTAPDNIIDDVEVTVKNGELNCGIETTPTPRQQTHNRYRHLARSRRTRCKLRFFHQN